MEDNLSRSVVVLSYKSKVLKQFLNTADLVSSADFELINSKLLIKHEMC